MRLWNLRTGLCLHTLARHTAGVASVALNEAYVVSGMFYSSSLAHHAVRVWCARTGAFMHAIAPKMHDISKVMMCAAHPHVVVVVGTELGLAGCTVHTYDIASGALLHEVRGLECACFDKL